jgi:hypothetical protein
MDASSKPVTQFELTPEIIAEIRGAFAEVDRAQMAITRRLTPAQRGLADPYPSSTLPAASCLTGFGCTQGSHR